jgi:cobalt/nickel transport system ATP-binding protein
MTSPTGHALELRGLTYKYPDGTPALRGVSFAISPGESVGLIGPNGAGKSTLLLHLNGLLPESLNASPDSAVTVGGLPMVSPNLQEIRRRVGLLFQDANDQLFCPTVWEDVAFGPRQLGLAKSDVAARVVAALERVGLAGFGERPPHHLSGGEKRRVCLAGVLACDPQILVLDEPTSSLDPRGRRQLINLLRELPLTQIIATHDLDMVLQLCPRSILLDGGVVIADGTTRDLLSNEELMLAHGLEVPPQLR